MNYELLKQATIKKLSFQRIGKMFKYLGKQDPFLKSLVSDDKRKIIENVFSSEKEISTAEGMKRALEMAGVFLEEASLDFLYI